MRDQDKGSESSLIAGTQIMYQEHEMKKMNILHKVLLTTLVITGKNGFEKHLSGVRKRFNAAAATRDKPRKNFQTTTQYANLVALKGEGSFRVIPVIIKLNSSSRKIT